jgi:acetyl-CoA C-acetyltransferase
MDHDALSDVFTAQGMGGLTESANTASGRFTREEQDAFAAAATRTPPRRGRTASSTTRSSPSDPAAQGRPDRVQDRRGHPRRHHRRVAGRPAPAFAKDGTITAGSASQISDGACAVVVMSKSKAEELGLTWLAEIGAHGVVAGPDSTLQSQPAEAIKAACAKEGIAPADLDLSRSTRPSPRSAWSRQGARRRPRTRSTPTAAPSPWATRSACPAPASSCTSPTS